jgi:hypothetical protein
METLQKMLEEKVEKYEKITARGIKEIKLKKGISAEQKKVAEDFLSMAKNYYNDAKYFTKRKELLIALAAFSYAHAWLDAGVRAQVFEATDDQLFTLP